MNVVTLTKILLSIFVTANHYSPYICINLKTIKTILSGSLTLFMLISAISYSVSFHFCGGEIRSITIFGMAPACDQRDKACVHDGNSNQSSISPGSCCENSTLVIASDTYRATDKMSVEFSQLIDIPKNIPIQLPAISKDLVRYNAFNYAPPFLEKDISILVRKFLI